MAPCLLRVPHNPVTIASSLLHCNQAAEAVSAAGQAAVNARAAARIK